MCPARSQILATAVAVLFVVSQAAPDGSKPQEGADKGTSKGTSGSTDLVGEGSNYKQRRVSKSSSGEVDSPLEPYQNQGAYERPEYVKGYAKLRGATYGKISYSRDDSLRHERGNDGGVLHERVNYGKVKYGGDDATDRENDNSPAGPSVYDSNAYASAGYLPPIYHREDYTRGSRQRGAHHHKNRQRGMSYMPVEYAREVYPYDEGDQQVEGQAGYSSRLHSNKIGGTSSVFDGGSYNYADTARYASAGGGDYEFAQNKALLQPGSSIQGSLSIFGGYGQGNGNLRYRDFVPYYGSDGYYSRHDNGGYGPQGYGSGDREVQPRPYDDYSNALNEAGFDGAFVEPTQRYKPPSGKKAHKHHGTNRSGLGAYIVGVEYVGRTPLLVQTQASRNTASSKDEPYWK
ncbi:hypothetical protein HPB48_001561 [Haemaphysalis longicornis]|uniref:Uncharacterized protein n=1 Tax=Haemaphysalis longicornis TaxID=44386 RepID=A0A9J6FE79_HAELO|nr:hypothetical protein HPB48_001561 [Haemaphysalis longicornis]